MLTKESVLHARNLAIEVIQSADQLWTYQIIAVLRTASCVREAVASIAAACAKRIELGTRFNAVLTDELVTEILTACRNDYHPSEDSPRQTFHQLADYHLDMALLVADNFLSEIASMHVGVPWDKPEYDEQMPIAAFGNRRHEAYWLVWAQYASNLTGRFDPYINKDDAINCRTRGEALLTTYRSAEYPATKLKEMVKVESACVLARLEKTAVVTKDSESKLDRLTSKLNAKQEFELSCVREREQWDNTREQLKAACGELKNAASIYANSEAKQSDVDVWANAILKACDAIRELGLWESLRRNSNRLESHVNTGGDGSYAMDLAVEELKVNLLLLSAWGKAKSEVVSLVRKVGSVSVSACGELWKDIWHADELEFSQVNALLVKYRAMERQSSEIAKLPLGPERDRAFQVVLEEERKLRNHPAFPKTVALSPSEKLRADIIATWLNLGSSLNEHERSAWSKWIDSPTPHLPNTSNSQLEKLAKHWADLFEGSPGGSIDGRTKNTLIDEFETGSEHFSDHRGNGKSYGDPTPSGDIVVDDPIAWFLAECELWVNTNQLIGLLSEQIGNDQLANSKTIEEILKLRRRHARIRNSLQSLQDEAAAVCLAHGEDPRPLFNIVRASEQAATKFLDYWPDAHALLRVTSAKIKLKPGPFIEVSNREEARSVSGSSNPQSIFLPTDKEIVRAREYGESQRLKTKTRPTKEEKDFVKKVEQRMRDNPSQQQRAIELWENELSKRPENPAT